MLKATISLQANGLWGQLAALKKVVMEPKGTGEAFDTVMKDYYTAIRRGQGGLFMAVCRGKVCTAAWTEPGLAQDQNLQAMQDAYIRTMLCFHLL